MNDSAYVYKKQSTRNPSCKWTQKPIDIRCNAEYFCLKQDIFENACIPLQIKPILTWLKQTHTSKIALASLLNALQRIS